MAVTFANDMLNTTRGNTSLGYSHSSVIYSNIRGSVVVQVNEDNEEKLHNFFHALNIPPALFQVLLFGL